MKNVGVIVFVILLVECTKQVYSRRPHLSHRRKRQAGYAYNKPSVPFDLPPNYGSSTTSTTQNSGYSYPTANFPSSTTGGSTTTTADGRIISTTADGRPISTTGATMTSGGYSSTTGSTGGYSPTTGLTGGYSPTTGSTGGYSPTTGSTGGYSSTTGSTGGYSPTTGSTAGSVYVPPSSRPTSPPSTYLPPVSGSQPTVNIPSTPGSTTIGSTTPGSTTIGSTISTPAPTYLPPRL